MLPLLLSCSSHHDLLDSIISTRAVRPDLGPGILLGKRLGHAYRQHHRQAQDGGCGRQRQKGAQVPRTGGQVVWRWRKRGCGWTWGQGWGWKGQGEAMSGVIARGGDGLDVHDVLFLVLAISYR